MKKIIFTLCAAAFLFTACGGDGKKSDNLITPEGIAELRLGDEKPGFGEPYAVDFHEDDYMGNHYTVRDGDGNHILTYFPPSQLEIYSPEYKTAEGYGVGEKLWDIYMDLKESGNEPELVYYRDSADFYFDLGNGIMLVVEPSALTLGQDRFNEWYLQGGDTSELDISNFADDTRISAIKISKW
ncbi:MAG: hypothetical protein LIO85_09505 [Rikenellaceae bacterium]|nr:hypothetical protein [Rikenellaceae bacterium]